MNSPDSTNKRGSYKRYYMINFEIGVILSLLIFISAFKIDISTEKEEIVTHENQEVVHMEEVIQTKQQEKAPAPPRPAAPVEVPNDEVIEEESIDINAELDLGESLDLPTEPPPSADEEEEEPEIFVIVERMPELKGGLASVQQYIKYPEVARKAGVEGRVIVEFVIDEQGKVNNPRVLRGIGGGCDVEALRVVKKLTFQPGMQRGKPVKVRYTMPIIFKLQTS